MIQEDKDLLMKDLSARLPYGLKGTVGIEVSTGEYSIESGHLLFMEKEIVVELLGINKDTEEIEVYSLDNNIDLSEYDYIIDDFKPYLRPLSSMTEEEVKEFYDVECIDAKVAYIKPTWNWHFTINGIDWLNANHFDYRGLIPKALAIEVTKENNPYK